jgi:hypothetical protein
MPTIHDKLREGLAVWVKLCGYDAEKKNDYHVGKTIKELNEALDLDDTSITGAMVLKDMLDRVLEHSEFKLRDAFNRDRKFLLMLKRARQLAEILKAPEIAEATAEFIVTITNALRHYDASEEAIKVAGDDLFVGMMRRDALRSMKRLNRFQFLRGPSMVEKAGYNPWIIQFLNINSLVEAVSQQPEYGVSLCMIRDEDAVFSYFVFACWNGGTLTILTDRPEWPHPMARKMTRRPDKQLDERWDQNHFPYELLNAEFAHKSVHIPKQTGLINFELQASKLAKINTCNPRVLIWLVMMFELIEKEHFTQNLQLADQSYTTEMVQSVVPSGTALVTRSGYEPCVLPILKAEDITFEKLKDDWEREPTGQHNELAALYIPKIPIETYNFLRDEKGKLLPPPEPAKQPKGVIPLKSLVAKIHEAEAPSRHFFGDDDKRRKLVGTCPTDFGTPESLAKTQRWAARYNQALAVNALAQADYEKHKLEVLEWFNTAALKNRRKLIEAVVRLSFKVTAPREKPDIDFKILPADETVQPTEQELLSVYYQHNGSFRWDHRESAFWGDGPKMEIDGGLGGKLFNRHLCAVNGSLATLRGLIVPNTQHDVAAITGVPIAEQPSWLRFMKPECYSGNSILDNVDPMEWVLDNPWKKLPLKMRIYLSVSAFKQWRKELGLEPFTDFDSLRHHDDSKKSKRR